VSIKIEVLKILKASDQLHSNCNTTWVYVL